MNQTTETLSAAPDHKSSPQNLPSDLTAAHGRAITATTAQQAAAVGLGIRAEARWPESGHDQTPRSLPGFIVSSFSPVAAEAAARCLSRRPAAGGDVAADAVSIPTAASMSSPASIPAAEPSPVTAILIATARGDRQSAEHVARTVAEGGLLGPLLFFQSVPNAVAGHIAARWNLTGPVVCLADAASALEAAAQLIQDGDADEALLLRIEQGSEGRDQAHAVLLSARNPTTPGERP